MDERAIVEFINKICEMDRKGQEPVMLDINGNKYINKQLTRIKDLEPQNIELNSLDSLAQLIRHEREKYSETLFVIVDSFYSIHVWTTLLSDLERDCPYIAKAHRIGTFDFGRFLSYEDFIIGLNSKFVHNDDVEYLTKLLSSVTNSESVTQNDDGISQTIETKRGVSLAQTVSTRPIVKLAPFRTFLEIEQPESQFLFRLKEGKAALFEADGGAWEIEAVRRIAEYLKKELSGVPDVTVLA